MQYVSIGKIVTKFKDEARGTHTDVNTDESTYWAGLNLIHTEMAKDTERTNTQSKILNDRLPKISNDDDE